MKYAKILLSAILFLSVGLAFAADKTIKITKVAGTVQLMKNGVVVMTIKPGDPIPTKLDSNVTFFVVNGTVEVEAGGMKITGVTGSKFKPSFSGNALVVASEGRASVVVKNQAGQSVVMTSNSEVKLNTTGAVTQVEVQKGRAVVSNPTGGGTQVVNAGESTSFSAVPPVAQTPTAPVVPAEEPAVTEETPAAEPVAVVPETSVNPVQEAEESTEVSGSTPS